MQGKVATIVENNLSKVIEDLGFELYEVEFSKKQNGMNLTLFIVKSDRPVNINDCELVHRTVDPILDELDPTNGAPYYLNVSSVGLDKPIKTDKDFKRNLGNKLVVKLFKSDNKSKEVIGKLQDFDEKSITIMTEDLPIVILRSNIASCKQNIDF